MVGNGDVVGRAGLFVRKVNVRNPEFLRVLMRDVDRIVRRTVELQTRIIPRLTEVNVRRKLLNKNHGSIEIHRTSGPKQPALKRSYTHDLYCVHVTDQHSRITKIDPISDFASAGSF